VNVLVFDQKMYPAPFLLLAVAAIGSQFSAAVADDSGVVVYLKI